MRRVTIEEFDPEAVEAMLRSLLLARQHGAVGELDRAALGLDLDVAADDDSSAEGDVAADDEASALAQGRRAGGDARLEVGDEPGVLGSRSTCGGEPSRSATRATRPSPVTS